MGDGGAGRDFVAHRLCLEHLKVEVLGRAFVDLAYRERLQTDPQVALEELASERGDWTQALASTGARIRIVQETTSSIFIVIPAVVLPRGSSAEQVLLYRAAMDPNFMSQLIANPHEAVYDLLAVTIPAGLQVDIVVEGDDELLVVVPALVGIAWGESPGQSDAVLAAWPGGGGGSRRTCQFTFPCNTCNSPCTYTRNPDDSRCITTPM